MTPGRRHPEWIRARAPRGSEVAGTRLLLRALGLHTVCEEARCPNLGECWRERTATFMLMGNTCTRNCRFCAVDHGAPARLDPTEPARVAEAAAGLELRHVVVTSVTRDDLPDGGAAHFAATAGEIKKRIACCRVELLVPDFAGNPEAVAAVVDSPVDVLNHNIETVPRLYPRVRPGADYERSLGLLRFAKQRRPELLTKSGLMLGLGETLSEVRETLAALRRAGCDIVTLGQYLQPTRAQLPVARYLHPDEFATLREEALRLGFRAAEAGPLVRSSYHAGRQVACTG